MSCLSTCHFLTQDPQKEHYATVNSYYLNTYNIYNFQKA